MSLPACSSFRYFRDSDFVVVEGRAALMLVEAKWGDEAPDRSLRYLKARFPDAEAWQVSATGRKDYATPEGIRVAPALALLGRLAQAHRANRRGRSASGCYRLTHV